MFRRQHHEGRAVERVRSRGEDADAPAPLQREIHLRPDALPDPVPLHRAHALGPPRQRLEIPQQLLHVGGDPEEPLPQLPLDHRRVAVPPADAALGLLVAEHRLAALAPVHRRGLLVGQAALQHLQEEPLVPAVVGGLAAGDLAVPVVREPHPPQLGLHVGDVVPGPLGRVDAVLEGGVLGGEAERVPPHRMEHVVPAHGRDSAPPRPRWSSSGRGPCGSCPTGRGTSPGNSTSAGSGPRSRRTCGARPRSPAISSQWHQNRSRVAWTSSGSPSALCNMSPAR